MAESHDSDRDTFTHIFVALAVNDAEPLPTRSEIDQLADDDLRAQLVEVETFSDRMAA